MIKIVDLHHRYSDGVHAVRGLNLSVGPGEIYCLFGANGAGKTTTINILLNFIVPTSGQALIHDIDVVSRPLEAKGHVSYLSENVQLYPNFTALQNLDFFVRLGGRKDVTREEAQAAIVKAGLQEDALDKKVGGFSKGMRQKLGIAICMVKDTPIMILDEPLSGLDPKAAHDLVGILEDLREQGKAILMSTHDIFRAKEMASMIGIMKNGVKLTELDRGEIVARNLEQLYLESMSDGEPVAGTATL